jgi:hypothetical protein
MIEQVFSREELRHVFKDYDDCQSWAEDKLQDCKFVWAELGDVRFLYFFRATYEPFTSQDKNSGLMRSPLILQVFATHLNSTSGAEDVPQLYAPGVDEDSDASAVVKYPPKGALALAAAAVSLHVMS